MNRTYNELGLRVEIIQNVDKDYCYAVLSSLNIDFDLQFENKDKSPFLYFIKYNQCFRFPGCIGHYS